MGAGILLTVCFAIGLWLIISAIFRSAADHGGNLAQRRMQALIEQELGEETQIDEVQKDRPSLASRIVDALSSRAERSSILHSKEGRSIIEWLDEQLIVAGVRDRMNPYRAIGVMLTFWVAGAVLTLMTVLAGLQVYFAVVVMLLSVVYPPLKLRQMKAVRKDLIDAELAFFIMELVMALSSGRTNIDDAILRVARNNASSSSAPLAREFELASTEYRVGGKDREEALTDIIRRTRNDGVEALVDALNAAQRTGSDPLTALREQSEQARRLRKQALRTFAAKKEPLVTLGMVATMGGGVIVLVTPMVINLFDVIGSVG